MSQFGYDSGVQVREQPQVQARAEARFISRVYGWMAIALMVSAIVALWTAASAEMQQLLLANRGIFIVLLLAELGLVMVISWAINRLSFAAAAALYLAYSVLTGLTLSVIFLVYTRESIATTFFVTAGTFGIMSAYGYTTQRDLTSIGNLLFMALIGLVIASVVNMFWANSTLYWIITYAGVLIFVGLTAYDTQKIKAMCQQIDVSAGEGRKYAVLGGLTLYLDFINLFLLLLRLVGRRR
jgi:uncharacterized protein